MKKILKIVLTVAFVAGSTSVFAQKLGRINMQELVFAMPETAEMQKNLEAYQKELQDQLETIGVEFNNKLNEYTKQVSDKNSTMSDSVRQLKEKELNDLKTRYDEFVQVSQQDMQKKQGELLEPIIVKAQDAVKEVSKAGGYTVVYDTSVNAVAYFDEAVVTDILPAVKTKLGITDTPAAPPAAPAAKSPFRQNEYRGGPFSAPPRSRFMQRRRNRGGYASAAGISEAPATDAAVCPSGSAPTNRSSASAAASGSSKNPMCPESASHTTCACGWAAANCSATAAGMYSSLRPKTKSCRTGERRSISLRSGRAIIPLRSATIPSSSVRYTCSVKSAMASAIRCRLSAANPAPGATRASCSFLPARTSAISRRRFSRFSSVSAFGVEEKSTRPSSISG